MKQQPRERQAEQAKTSEKTPIREHWTAQEPGISDEAIAGSLLRSAALVPPFSQRDKADVAARLRAKEHVRARPLAWQLVIAVGLILLGSALSAAVMEIRRRVRSSTDKPAPIVANAALKAVPKLRRSTARPDDKTTSATVLPTTPSPDALPTPRPSMVPTNHSVAPPPRRRGRQEEPASMRAPSTRAVPFLEPAPSVVPSPGPSALAQDSRPLPTAAPASFAPVFAQESRPMPSTALAPAQQMPPPAAVRAPGPTARTQEKPQRTRGIAKLRRENAAGEALAILDEHRAAFGAKGALAQEATAARIEALLRLGRDGEALALLDARALTNKGPSRELLLARAELRAGKGRNTAALRDFDALLSTGSTSDDLGERALYGRAVCRAKLGDAAGARHDFESYLAILPMGRFAEKARAALEHNLR